MKHLFPILFLFLTIIANGQDDTTDSAQSLYLKGVELLQKEKASPFDKVLALAKFRKSQQLINSAETENPKLQAENDTQINILVDFFSKVVNSDSLLRTTRFFPDSVFQADRRYSSRIKSILPDLLEIKRRNTRSDFSKVDALNYRSQLTENGSDFILTFERYWPIEVIEFEAYINGLEKNYRNLSDSDREELFFTKFKHDLDSLSYSAKINSLEMNTQHILQQKEGIEVKLDESQNKYTVHRRIAFGIFTLLLLWGLYTKKKSSQLLKSANQNLLEEKKRSEELLLNILPAEVARELKTHNSVKAKKHQTVSVLFSDFKNFSKIAEKLTPEELVGELDFCFKEFDRIIDKHRLQKIKTIGDAYMCVGGLYTQGNSHINRMILAALEIQKFLEKFKRSRMAEGKHFFEARIGIHTGPIVAGVVGTKKFAFDVWGDTVNVAQQMEANGEPGKVNISGETYMLVKDDFTCIFRCKLTAKNQKEFDMYFVEKQNNMTLPKPFIIPS